LCAYNRNLTIHHNQRAPRAILGQATCDPPLFVGIQDDDREAFLIQLRASRAAGIMFGKAPIGAMETIMESPKKSARRKAGPPPYFLRDLQKVYSHPKSKDETSSQKSLRAFLKKDPRRFVSLLIDMEQTTVAEALKRS